MPQFPPRVKWGDHRACNGDLLGVSSLAHSEHSVNRCHPWKTGEGSPQGPAALFAPPTPGLTFSGLLGTSRTCHHQPPPQASGQTPCPRASSEQSSASSCAQTKGALSPAMSLGRPGAPLPPLPPQAAVILPTPRLFVPSPDPVLLDMLCLPSGLH